MTNNDIYNQSYRADATTGVPSRQVNNTHTHTHQFQCYLVVLRGLRHNVLRDLYSGDGLGLCA